MKKILGLQAPMELTSVLAIRQLGYLMRGALSKESITPFIAQGFNDPNARIFQRV